jgi:hypothetical protein
LQQAPELLAQFASQVNSCQGNAADGSAPPPPPVVRLRREPGAAPLLWFYPFYFNRHSVADSVDHVLGWGEPESVKLRAFTSVTYLPLTECAIRDPGFQRVVAEAIGRTYFDATGCLLIRLPAPASQLPSRFELTIQCLAAARMAMPRVRARNIFFVAHDLAERTLAPVAARLSFILHESVEFWCYTRALYEGAAKIRVALARGEAPGNASADPRLREFYTQAFGRTPEFLARPPVAADP